MGKNKGAPPFELVKLSSIPESLWFGLPVFHPCAQMGDEPIWEYEFSEEEKQNWDEDTEDWEKDPTAYDVGVVTHWYPDNYPAFADLNIVRVKFVCSNGSTWLYSSDNLWVPKVLVERVMR